MNCIYARNNLSGFARAHTIFCLYCEEPATHHFYLGFGCGNVCRRCAKRWKGCVEEGISTPDRGPQDHGDGTIDS